MGIEIRVQTGDFDPGAEIERLRLMRHDAGAVVAFVGQVRDINAGAGVSAMTLEHYPGMTEKALDQIARQAAARWHVPDILIIHRIGTLQPVDRIVLVITVGAHRGEAFAACEFIMDYLKTGAPFWKKEHTASGERWVDARESDDAAARRWKAQ